MEFIEHDVVLRQVVPTEGKVIHKIDTDEYYIQDGVPQTPFIGKDEPKSNYEEVNISDVPALNSPDGETAEEAEDE